MERFYTQFKLRLYPHYNLSHWEGSKLNTSLGSALNLIYLIRKVLYSLQAEALSSLLTQWDVIYSLQAEALILSSL